MNAVRVGGFVIAAFNAIPVFILLRTFGNLRREFKRHGIGRRESAYTFLSTGGWKGFLLFAGWTLALIAGVLLAVFS